MIEQLQHIIDVINKLKKKDRLYMNQKTFEQVNGLVKGISELKELGLIIIANHIPDNQVVKFHDNQKMHP